MAAASCPTTSGTKINCVQNKQEETARHPTVEELLIQIENHLYKNIEHRASLLIAVWSCLAGKFGYFRNMEKVFHMLYRESAMTIFSGQWPKVNLLFKRGLSRALIHFSHSLGSSIKDAEGLCSALVMATYDPWGDPVIHKLIRKEDIDQNLVDDFIRSEPFELLVIRVECLVNARFEEAAIRLCRCCLKSKQFRKRDEGTGFEENWRWTFMEWLLRLLFRKGRLNDLVTESNACSCHDGVRLIYRTRNSPLDDSESLTETLINLFLVRDLLFQSNYCCTSELMSLWCDFQVRKQRTASEIQDAAKKLLIGHASSSAQFYLFVDILWGRFGPSLLPLYIEMYVRGLTSDLNYLEAARQADKKEYVIEIENHMAAMYFKLSSMFHNINKEIALECMLSSFSLDPTKERLDWIKKLSLQISKEKALKLAAAKNEACKHKLCNKPGCTYPHPLAPKKKSVIMCDQAIQVGDDSFENECDFKMPMNCVVYNNVDSIINSTSSQIEKSVIEDKVSDISDAKECESKEYKTEQNCLPNSCDTDINSKSDLESSIEKNECRKDDAEIANINSSEQNVSDITEIDCKINKKEPENCTDVVNSINLHDAETPEKNYVPHNGEINEIINDTEKDYEHYNSKIEDELTAHTETKLELTPAKSHKNRYKESSKDVDLPNHNITENGSLCSPETESNLLSVPSKSKSKPPEETNSFMKNDIDEGKLCNDVCVNGCDEPKKAVPDEVNPLEPMNQVKKSDDALNGEKVSLCCKSDEKNLVNSDNITQNVADFVHENNNQNIECIVNADNSENLLKNECKQNDINLTDKTLISIEEEVIKEKQPFTHIVLDSKISGLNEDLLSDFVIVLESLRNKQLKSSCKWSQIKHLCEDYLVNVTQSRCMMLNMQTNGSVDSEADSVSEFTHFKGFESHQSDDSIIEDHYADKSHVLKRFMHNDKNTEMATYVNLSDIHCPQIPLEKLFYTERSSSHIIHKKRHKKHRNHEKNPEKVVLRKLRHSSRADHDLVKRKKRKKRKGKRTKNHLKKHHSAHVKNNKDYLKNKKKKHKLKKKKEERNSGFISGDYCSDFSSAELMRLVKEHSHSYSKLPATTSKHPRSIGSSSEEPNRKKRKVTFDKKKQKTGKYHDKHKHQKSKSSKRKKKLAAIESCKDAVKKVTDHALHGKLDAVNDYSRIVQYSSVKKMEAVQIRQQSLALNLSKMARQEENPSTLVNPCASNSQLQQLVQQNFESSEDIMKMQLLMAQQQQHAVTSSIDSSFLSSANNQAVLKYVCSKMTSHLLSVAQSSNCNPSDSEGSKPSTPTHAGRVYQSQSSQPKNLASNVKHVIFERGGVPYKLSTSSSLAGTIIPVSCLSSATTDTKSLMGTVFSGGITYPATATSPQVTTFTIPVAHTGSKLVASKIVIPVNQCSNIRGASSTPIALPAADTRNLAGTSGTPPLSSVIIVKNGNNTQIISGIQQQSSVLPCLSSSKASASHNRYKPSPIVSKTVPKIIKQAAKKLTQPATKRPLAKTLIGPKLPTSLNSEIVVDPIATSSLLACKELELSKPEICATSVDSLSKDDTSNSFIPTEDCSKPMDSETDKESSNITNEPLDLVSSSTLQEKITVQENDVSDKKAIASSDENKEELVAALALCTKSVPPSSPVKDLLSDTTIQSKQSNSIPSSPIGDEMISSPKEVPDETTVVENDSQVESELPHEETEQKKEVDSTIAEIFKQVSSSDKTSDALVKAETEVEKVSSPLQLDEKDEEIKSPASVEKPDSLKDDSENTINNTVLTAEDDNKAVSETKDDEEVPLKMLSTQRTDHSSIKPVNLSTGDQEKQLQPINDAEISSGKASPKASSETKNEGRTSEAPTRSFTSISDAVRFSLMDMDDATDSVENQDSTAWRMSSRKRAKYQKQSACKDLSKKLKTGPTTCRMPSRKRAKYQKQSARKDLSQKIKTVVLQAFQTSRASSPGSPAYAASESGGEEPNSPSPSSAVMLSAPQSANTTELNVSNRVTQRFEPTVAHSQAEKFTECQNTVSRTTSWILDDAIAEASPAVAVQKSPEIDSCGESKEEDKPKKKRKKKERVDNDVTHKFWCQICSKGFFSAYNLRRHCRNVHKMLLPKGSSDVPFANSSQCLPHIQQTETAASETSSSRLSYGNVQTSCVSPNKGSEYSMLSPTHENKQEYSVKTNQHVPQIQSAEFQMQTPPRMTSQSSSTHISPVTPPKDFRLGTPTSVSPAQISPNKMSPVKSPSQSKFQRLPTGSQVPQMAKMSQMQQIALCGQQALQQQRQISQMQSPGLIQPLPSVACQAQAQIQASQCPHFQANKQMVQQRIGQLQLMHHVAQLPSVQHATHGIQKQAQNQSFKKCNTNQSASKIPENEQMQQAAQLAQNQQLLANQQMQKLIQIRQNAIAASGIASQLSLANAIPSVPGSPVKGATPCFQSQLAAARQAAVVGQIPTAQRAQGTGYNLSSHDTSGHQFFSPAVQPSPDQTNCPHSSFSTQNMSEFSANTPSYPTIRLSSEANDGLEDLEQFLLENMPWSGEQSSAHGLSQQSGNRPSSADSLTLAIPSQTTTTSQNRSGVTSKSKASISRPKPRKPVATPCSKNLLGNLGRGVKKKPPPKKTSKSSETECAVSKSDVFPQANILQSPHELKQCSKDTIGNIPNFSKTVKTNAVGVLHETDSSDSVQCINMTHNAPPKNASMGINFNIFSPVGLCASEKNTDLMCNPSSCKEAYDGQRKNSFLDHSNLAGTSSSNLDPNKSSININQCETANQINMGSAFNNSGKSSAATMKPFCTVPSTPYGITNETPNPQDIFLGQRNSETSDSNNSDQNNKNGDIISGNLNTSTVINSNNLQSIHTSSPVMEKSSLERNLFLGGNSKISDEKSEFLNKEATKDSISENLKDNTCSSSVENIGDISEHKEESASELEKCFDPQNSVKMKLHDNTTKGDLQKFESSDPVVASDKLGMEEMSKEETDEMNEKESDEMNEKESDEMNEKESDEMNEKETEEIKKEENGEIKKEETEEITKEGTEEIKKEGTEEIKKEGTEEIKKEGTEEIKKEETEEMNKEETAEINKELEEIREEEPESTAEKYSKFDVDISATVEETGKENQIIPSNIDHVINDFSVPDTPKTLLKHKAEENSFVPKVVNRDDHSNHEDTNSNDENHLPKENDLENINNDIGLNRIALRVRKSQDSPNKLIENVPFFVSDKDDVKSSVIKKNVKKKKAKQENRKDENVIGDTKISCKLDGDTKIQKTGLLNIVNKDKDLNRSLCMITSCYDGIKKNSIENESHDNGFCLDEKQLEETNLDGIPAPRLRLRDTPKTSVKRVCPCCMDAKLPKKCRANGGGNINKLIGSKVSNNLKAKSTLKTRNTTNGHNGKVNTRSSQRLRSRNNAIS